MSFLTRRQADRTTLMFGICVFMLKRPPQLFRSNVLATSPGGSKPKLGKQKEKDCLAGIVNKC
ncbi:MAG: hypothetical protein DME87_08460 [Verrucomicrobia bacterium]|nr:MAG: hypothetical protein DME87_08460 [Verrucomicrobiota bacterium]